MRAGGAPRACASGSRAAARRPAAPRGTRPTTARASGSRWRTRCSCWRGRRRAAGRPRASTQRAACSTTPPFSGAPCAGPMALLPDAGLHLIPCLCVAYMCARTHVIFAIVPDGMPGGYGQMPINGTQVHLGASSQGSSRRGSSRHRIMTHPSHAGAPGIYMRIEVRWCGGGAMHQGGTPRPPRARSAELCRAGRCRG